MQPEVDLWCPGAVASAVQLARDAALFRARVSVTVRLELAPDHAHVIDGSSPGDIMHVSMDELTAWPVSEETLKRPDGVRVELPRVVARLRVHHLQGPREPLQDLPLDVQSLAIDGDRRLADAGLRTEFTIADPGAKLIALIGIALGNGAIRWPSRDQVVAERALTRSHLHATIPSIPALGGSGPRAEPIALPKPHLPPRKGTRPPPPPKAGISAPQPPPARKSASAPAPESVSAVLLDPNEAVSLDPDDPVTLAPDSQNTAVRLDGTVVISGGDRPPPSQRMALSVHNPTPLAAWTVPWKLQGKHSLTLVLKATCDLRGDGSAALVRDSTDAPRGDGFHSDDPAGTLLYPSDHALLKYRADVALVGRAYAPAGRASRATVSFRFGAGANAFERHFAVFGPREWRDGAPSSPQLFRSVPLIYERAFGGPGFDRNPVGVGFGNGHRGRFLPSLEDPARLLGRRGDQRRPCCPAPLSPSWERRWKRVGQTWRGRLEEKWDELPDDFNWEFFQCAPQAQQLDYLTGDEPFEILGVRPDDAPLRAQLPSLRPTCTASSAQGARPIPVHIDTVLIDAEAMTLQILWRGLLSVSAPHAPELSAISVAY